VPAPDTASFESRRPFLPTSTGTVESQRVFTFRSPVVEKPANLEAGRGVSAAPPNNGLARFSAIFRIVKSRNYPLRYRNFAEISKFLKKS
jgi:hypothetical protein